MLLNNFRVNKEKDTIKSKTNDLSEMEISLLIEEYQVLSDRRIGHDELMWNVPLMFLTAQAFLLMIVFGQDTQLFFRAVAAFISLCFGILSIQVFSRNRVMEIADAEQLSNIENYLITKGYQGVIVHHVIEKRNNLDGETLSKVLEDRNILHGLNDKSSYEFWKIGMWLTTIISFFAFLSIMLDLTQIIPLSKYNQDKFIYLSIFIVEINLFVYILLMAIFNKRKCLFEKNNLKRKCLSSLNRKFKVNFIVIIVLLIFEFLFITWLIIFKSNNTLIMMDYVFLFGSPALPYLVIFLSPRVKIKLFGNINHKNNKSEIKSENVINVVLAGGNNRRLTEHIPFNKIPKFKAIRIKDKNNRDNISILESTLIRNRVYCCNQIIITNEKSYVDLEDCLTANFPKENIRLEPEVKDTGVAIFLAIKSVIEDYGKLNEDIKDVVLVITPIDHLIKNEAEYTLAIEKAINLARYYDSLFLIGIKPDYPSEKYGYIKYNENNQQKLYFDVKEFIEKPGEARAHKLIEKENVFWNGGIFVAKLSVLENIYNDLQKELVALYNNNVDSYNNKLNFPSSKNQLRLYNNTRCSF